jgi:hypothetical protein
VTITPVPCDEPPTTTDPGPDVDPDDTVPDVIAGRPTFTG